MERQSKEYNQIIGVLNTGEIVVLQQIFKYGVGLSGANGYIMDKLTQTQIDAYVEDDELAKDYWKVDRNNTELGFEDWLETMSEELGMAGLYYLGDDSSYRLEMDEAYNKLTVDQKKQLDEIFGVKGKDFVDYTCTRRGRCINFDEAEYKVILDEELLKEVQDVERY